jgi:tetratricopeptide (TPR) repeat protein
MDDLAPPASTLTEANGTSGSALADWAALAERSFDDPTLLLPPIQALCAAGHPAEAAVLLDAAQFRFPDHAPFAVEAARVAQQQGATEDALRRWQAVRDRFPASPAGITGAAATLRAAGRVAEAEAMLAEAIPDFAADPGPAIDHAWLAHAQRDWPEALRRWSAVREQFPHQPQGYSGAAIAYRDAGDFDQADLLLQEAIERFPNVAWLTFEHGWVAHIRRDWPEASRRWEIVRAHAPEVLVGYTEGAAALRELGRMTEAEALLRDAAERFPNEARVVIEQAWLAQARRDWPEAVRYWDIVRARLPGEEVAYTAGARALREQQLPDAADRLLREAIQRFPDRRAPLTEYAWLAQIGRDWPASVDRWAVVRMRFPDHAEAYVQAARALAELGRQGDAETLLAEGIAQRPGAAEIAVEYAEMAERRQNWTGAVVRWGDAEARFPDNKLFSQRLQEARRQLMPSDPVPAWSAAAPEPDAEAVDGELRELALQFESLGGQMLGCEFGIFQRDCGAEPVGLLSWADMPCQGLIAALESRFDGIGTEPNTELVRSSIDGGRAAYCTRDRRGFMLMWTFIGEDEVPFDRIHASVCRRLQFLARKLIEDLERGDRVFVYRVTDRTLTEAELARLHAAMRSYGDNTLLYVRYQDAGHPNGSVELAGPGLMLGYIDRFKVSPSGEVSASLPTASWLTLCRNAWELWRSLRI